MTDKPQDHFSNPPVLIKSQRKFKLTHERNTLILRISITPLLESGATIGDGDGLGIRAKPMIWDNYANFRTN